MSAALLFVIPLSGPPTTAMQPSTPAQSENVPPISYTCPMHPEIIDDKKGICPICKMDLVAIRLDSVWTCGSRPRAVIESKPGRCPIYGTPLAQRTAAVAWTRPVPAQD